jgi:hypothetical protein
MMNSFYAFRNSFVLFLEVFLPLFYEKYLEFERRKAASFIWLEFQAYVVNESHCLSTLFAATFKAFLNI